ncbi:MAG: hypothetical protein K2Q24_01815 [Chitinophagaceae bacterium]|jgi:3-hydroxybutyryl-CoA dehydrogenase|nr:hypothetical protein [Chitinophagaceae bacterium]
MNILILSGGPVTTLFGKTLPLKGTLCKVADKLELAEAELADVLIDLDFESNSNRISYYLQRTRPVLIGSVLYTLHQLQVKDAPVARFNHWPGFLNRNTVEIAFSKQQEALFQSLFQQWEIPFLATADEPGFVTARTISMIINEAFITEEQQVTTADEIDTAMKLGTGYPFGPFEWSKLIGIEHIKNLLQILAVKDHRYQPTASLLQFKAAV